MISRIDRVEIPRFLSHLEVYGGFPVPFTQMWIDGKPDFRVMDSERVQQCAEEKLCAICGHRLGEFAFFIGGPLSKANHLFADPAMHERCADFASRTCPFVSGDRHEYSTRAVKNAGRAVIKIDEMVSTQRPSTMFILKTRTKHVRAVTLQGQFLIQTGRWVGQKTVSPTSEGA